MKENTYVDITLIMIIIIIIIIFVVIIFQILENQFTNLQQARPHLDVMVRCLKRIEKLKVTSQL
jgi:hypothetical protein